MLKKGTLQCISLLALCAQNKKVLPSRTRGPTISAGVQDLRRVPCGHGEVSESALITSECQVSSDDSLAMPSLTSFQLSRFLWFPWGGGGGGAGCGAGGQGEGSGLGLGILQGRGG